MTWLLLSGLSLVTSRYLDAGLPARRYERLSAAIVDLVEESLVLTERGRRRTVKHRVATLQCRHQVLKTQIGVVYATYFTGSIRCCFF